jgi:hypothetical protein
MNLGQLKEALAKLEEMDDKEVLLLISQKGEKEYDNLCFVGMSSIPARNS